HGGGARGIRRLRDVGRLPGPQLSLRQLPVALLLARALPPVAARLVRAAALRPAGVAALLAGAPHPLGAGRLPHDLLLLSRRLLQGVLGRPALVPRGGAARRL